MLADMENVIECGVQCSMRGEGCHMFQWNDVTKDKCSNIQISKVLVSSGDVFPDLSTITKSSILIVFENLESN